MHAPAQAAAGAATIGDLGVDGAAPRLLNSAGANCPDDHGPLAEPVAGEMERLPRAEVGKGVAGSCAASPLQLLSLCRSLGEGLAMVIGSRGGTTRCGVSGTVCGSLAERCVSGSLALCGPPPHTPSRCPRTLVSSLPLGALRCVRHSIVSRPGTPPEPPRTCCCSADELPLASTTAGDRTQTPTPAAGEASGVSNHCGVCGWFGSRADCCDSSTVCFGPQLHAPSKRPRTLVPSLSSAALCWVTQSVAPAASRPVTPPVAQPGRAEPVLAAWSSALGDALAAGAPLASCALPARPSTGSAPSCRACITFTRTP